jgi:hypothetical protein
VFVEFEAVRIREDPDDVGRPEDAFESYTFFPGEAIRRVAAFLGTLPNCTKSFNILWREASFVTVDSEAARLISELQTWVAGGK